MKLPSVIWLRAGVCSWAILLGLGAGMVDGAGLTAGSAGDGCRVELSSAARETAVVATKTSETLLEQAAPRRRP